jgi:hypothetical protein
LKVDFKILNMMQLRSSPGEVLDRVSQDGEAFVIERNRQPRACLVPVSFLLPDIPPDRIALELERLREKDEKYKLTINEHNELEISCHETAAGDDVVITVVLPHGYPSAAPKIHVDPVPENTPHRWHDGSLSIFGATAIWKPKSHDVVHTLNLARKWIRDYARWKRNGEWPADLERRHE